MRRFASYDGTELGYRVVGDGPPLVCLPGGPGRAAQYLGDLGGLGRSRRLILLDSRPSSAVNRLPGPRSGLNMQASDVRGGQNRENA